MYSSFLLLCLFRYWLHYLQKGILKKKSQKNKERLEIFEFTVEVLSINSPLQDSKDKILQRSLATLTPTGRYRRNVILFVEMLYIS